MKNYSLSFNFSHKKIIKSIICISISVFLCASISFAQEKWLSFENGRGAAASLNNSNLKVARSGNNAACKLTINIPGAVVSYPDDNGMLAGKYASLSFSTIDNPKLTCTHINGTLTPAKLGKPDLPFVRFQVRIPYAASDGQIRIEVANTNYKACEGKYAVAPVQQQLFESFVAGVDVDNRVFQQDKAVYARDEYFNHELEYEVGIFHGVKIVDIYFSPVKYNPVTQTLLATNTAQIVVNYTSSQLDDNEKTVYRALANSVTFDGINGSTIPDYTVNDLPRGGKFIVVSHSDFIDKATFNDWVNYRKGQGYELVKTINATSMTASAITSEIKSAYSSAKFDYVMIVGDETKVPIPTDGDSYHYKNYSRLDGTDDIEDVGLGIFLCDDDAKFKNILNHQKWHETGGTWSKTQLSTSGSEVSNGTWNRFSTGHYGTVHLDDPGGTLGYTVHRVYQVASIPTKYGGSNIGLPIVPFEAWTLNPTPFFTSGTTATAEIIKFWNEGVVNISHRDHGAISGPSSPPMSYTLFSTGKITSTCSPFFTSLNCLTGNFKAHHTNNFSYLAQSSQYGPCVNIGATVVTYSGDNDNLHNALYLAMYPKTGTPVTNIGQIWLVGHLKGQSHSRTYFHMYGDPMTNLAIGTGGKPFISISSPNGGELIEQGSTYNIAWGDNIDGNVKIELLKGGSVVKEIAGSTPSDGSHDWLVAADLQEGSDYKIKITSVDSTALFDMSDNNFSIAGEYIISQFPYYEPLDTLDTGTTTLPYKWDQPSGDDIDWIVWTGKTPTKYADQGAATGPDGDHTSGSGKYIYVESSFNNYPAKKADYVTPKFNFKALYNPRLTFWYHMFSNNSGTDEMGDLYLDICVDGTWKSDVFHVAKNQGDVWKLHTVDLTQYKADRTIFRFRAVTGSGWASDICIDDFKIAEDPSPIIQIVQTKPSSFDLKYYGSRIYFEVPENTQVSPVSIKLYNPQGKLVKILVNKNANPGSYSLQLENISTGLYLCRMEAAGFKKTIHVMISK